MARILAFILVILAVALGVVTTAPVQLERWEQEQIPMRNWSCPNTVRKCIEGVSRPVAMEKFRITLVCVPTGGIIGPPKEFNHEVEQPTACKAI